MEGGYIKASRALKSWGWYKDSATLHVWLHLLLSANYEPQMFMGRSIQRGQVVTSYPSLAESTGLSIQSVRTAIKHLKSTGEILMQTTKHYSVITIPKYDEYQSSNSQLTDNQQATNSLANRLANTNKRNKKEEIPPVSPYADFGFTETVCAKLDEWQAYKREMRKPYKPTGLKSLLTTVAKQIERLGETAVIDRITEAMANSWQGMNLDKLPANSLANSLEPRKKLKLRMGADGKEEAYFDDE